MTSAASLGERAESFLSLDEELVQFDQTYKTTSDIRNSTIDKLKDMVGTIDSSRIPMDKDVFSAHMGTINTLLRALNDADASSMRRVTAKTNKAQLENEGEMSQEIAQLLRASFQNDITPEELDDTLTSAAEEFEIEVQENDPIKDTELRDDPKDLS